MSRQIIRELGTTQMPLVVGGIIRTYPPNECFNYTDDMRTNCPTATCTCTSGYD